MELGTGTMSLYRHVTSKTNLVPLRGVDPRQRPGGGASVEYRREA
ncbi:hypothetical protein AADR41_02155 [Streptomyces sp. CLV115]